MKYWIIIPKNTKTNCVTISILSLLSLKCFVCCKNYNFLVAQYLYIFQVAYTFDAGPNACLYLLEKDVPEMLALIKNIFPPEDENTVFIKGYKSSLGTISQV